MLTTRRLACLVLVVALDTLWAKWVWGIEQFREQLIEFAQSGFLVTIIGVSLFVATLYTIGYILFEPLGESPKAPTDDSARKQEANG